MRMTRGPLAVALLLLALGARGGEAPSPARVFVSLLNASGSTPEQRREAWKAMLEGGKQPPRQVAEAVDGARERAWRRLAQAVVSTAARKGGLKLRSAISPHQDKVIAVVQGADFSKAKLDEAMAPIEKALDEAQAPLLANDAYKALVASIQEFEGYAAGCGLRIGWNEQLGETLCTLAFVSRYAGKPGNQLTVDANRRWSDSFDPSEHACIARLNVERILIGLAPMEIDLRLVIAAKKHSEEMVAKGYFAHDSPTPELKSFSQRAGREHTGASGECIAAGSGDGVGVFKMWYYSQGHHKIMISGSSCIGVGRCKETWTLMVGGSKMTGVTATNMAKYVRRRYEGGDDAPKLFLLAKWCAENKLLIQAQDELERVVALDPKNEDAKKALERIRARK